MLQSQAIQRFDLSLRRSDFDLIANREGFIGLKVMPPAGVAVPAAEFSRETIKTRLAPPRTLVRAPRAGYAKDEFGWGKDSFATQEHGLESDVDDAEIELFGDFLRAEQIAADRVVDQLLQEHERDVAAMVFNTGSYTGNQTIALSGTETFQATATSTPVATILKAKRRFRRFGLRANCLIIPELGLDYMMQSQSIIDRIKFSGVDDPKDVTMSMLKALLKLDHILVADGYKNLTPDGTGAATIGRFWDPTMAMVCRIADGRTELTNSGPCIGRTVMFTKQNAQIPGIGASSAEGAIIMEEYREESRRGGVIRGRWNYQLKDFSDPMGDNTFFRAGVLLTNVTDGTDI
ncbi:hypothetical protein [Schlesneria sp.]|uniref:hypothetical protein n=1 Tax=Schlesneria sp. TaxID=2762018 RepID=UPI002F1F438F